MSDNSNDPVRKLLEGYSMAGKQLDVQSDSPPAEELATYYRTLADGIDSGEVLVEGMTSIERPVSGVLIRMDCHITPRANSEDYELPGWRNDD